MGDELRPRMISRGTRFLSGEPGWCQLGGSVTDFTEERERRKKLNKMMVKDKKTEKWRIKKDRKWHNNGRTKAKSFIN